MIRFPPPICPHRVIPQRNQAQTRPILLPETSEAGFGGVHSTFSPAKSHKRFCPPPPPSKPSDGSDPCSGPGFSTPCDFSHVASGKEVEYLGLFSVPMAVRDSEHLRNLGRQILWEGVFRPQTNFFVSWFLWFSWLPQDAGNHCIFLEGPINP